MNKKVTKVLFSSVLIGLALSQQAVDACSAFIIGKGLTKDGSYLYGRTEDYPFPHGDWDESGKYVNNGTWEHTHNKNFFVKEARSYGEGAYIEDVSNGFKYPHLSQEYKYTVVADDTRDTKEGEFSEHGFNEHGVSMTATVTATPRAQVVGGKAPKVAADGRELDGEDNKIEYPGVDPLVKNGIAEAIMTDLILPRVKTAREAVELLAKVIDEKGSAEGNIMVFADKNELWYMEIYSGHQYVAYKYPDDKFSIFPNTYFLGELNINDKENVIASKDIITTAQKAGVFKGDADKGIIDLAGSYAPKLSSGDRSRVYAGIKLLNPSANITYKDERYAFLQDSPRKDFTVKDGLDVQRNRFESLNGELIPDDQIPGYVSKSNYSAWGFLQKDDPNYGKYAYAPGNENVVDPHVYQINNKLPESLGGVMWLSLGRSRNTPYVPYFGSIKDTFEAYKVRGAEYSPNSWYWVATNIDNMTMEHPELFGKSIRSNWEKMEALLFEFQDKLVAEYTGKSDDYVKEHADEYTTKATTVAETVFKLMKNVEAQMQKAIENKAPLASPFLDVTPLKDVLDRLSAQPTVEEPTTVTPTTEEPTTVETTTVETTKTGFVGDNYYDETGKQVFNQWVQDNGKWYFIYNTGTVAKGWMMYGGDWYYLDETGVMKENQWANINGKWYFFYNTGAMAKGWLMYSGTWYYLEDSGAMKENQWFQLNGKWYYVDASGSLLVNTVTPDGYRVNQNGEWM